MTPFYTFRTHGEAVLAYIIAGYVHGVVRSSSTLVMGYTWTAITPNNALVFFVFDLLLSAIFLAGYAWLRWHNARKLESVTS